MTDLPVNIDSSYADDALLPGRKIHQQHHDALHAQHNALGLPGGPAGPLTADGKLPASQSGTVVLTQAGTPSAPTTIEPLRISPPDGDTHGPFGMVIGGALFQTTFDRTMYLGYNVADGGGRAVAAEPSFRFVIESDYDDGTKRSMEPYWEWAKAANAGRSFADAVTTSGSKTVTSATAAFVAADAGAPITGSGIPANTTIAGVVSATEIRLSANATATASGVTLTITPTSQQRRPIFFQIDRANGNMTSAQLRVPSLTIKDWNTDAELVTLAGSSLALKGYAAQPADTVLTIGAQNGKRGAIQMTGGFILQAATNDHWQFFVGGSTILEMTQHKVGVGDSTLSGTLTVKVPVAQKDNDATVVIKKTAGQTSKLIRVVSDTATYWVTEPDGHLTLGAININLDTTTGTKLGTAANQKLALWGAPPVVQPAANPDTSGATLAALETEVNEVKALLRSIGAMAN